MHQLTSQYLLASEFASDKYKMFLPPPPFLVTLCQRKYTAQQMKSSIKDFFSKCDQIRHIGHIYWRNP